MTACTLTLETTSTARATILRAFARLLSVSCRGTVVVDDKLLSHKAPTHALARYLSPCPEGYDTVLGYLARNNPEALALIQDPVEDTKRDGFWLCHRSLERDWLVRKVPAPMILQDEGIDRVNAYPLALLAERLD